MDLENQKRVKEFAEEYGAENLVVVLGAAEGEAAGGRFCRYGAYFEVNRKVDNQ